MAGVAADRMDRQKLMLRTQYLLIVTAVAMGGLVVSGWLQVWHIFVFTLITGIGWTLDRKSTRLNSSHLGISYAVFCLKKKKKINKILHDHTKELNKNELLSIITIERLEDATRS